VPIVTAVRGTVDLTAGQYEAVVAELNELHEARDWTDDHKRRYRELCEVERALRRRRKVAHLSRTA
jgi:hypothetical protein